MENDALTRQWINATLNNLIEDTCKLKIQHARDLLKSSFQKKVDQQQSFTIEEWLIACLGDFIFWDMINNSKIHAMVDKTQRYSSTQYARPLYFSDVSDNQKLFNMLFNDRLKNLQEHHDLEKKTAFDWLQLIDQLAQTKKFEPMIQMFSIMLPL